jgi:carboxymethylenebutenolidase
MARSISSAKEAPMTQRLMIPTAGGEMAGVLELPAGDATAPGVVVIQEWWGIDERSEQAKAVLGKARRWAEAGFVAILPDLYHGKYATTADDAGALMKSLDFQKATQEIAATIDFLRKQPRCNGKVVVTGYCMGGALTFKTAVDVRGLSCVVPFYGLPGDLEWSKIDAPIQAHFAKHDDWATIAGAEKIKAAVKVPMELHSYDAQHAFCNDHRPEVHDPAAAALAWKRAVEFVTKHTT